MTPRGYHVERRSEVRQRENERRRRQLERLERLNTSLERLDMAVLCDRDAALALPTDDLVAVADNTARVLTAYICAEAER
jgi:hypothetical protein